MPYQVILDVEPNRTTDTRNYTVTLVTTAMVVSKKPNLQTEIPTAGVGFMFVSPEEDEAGFEEAILAEASNFFISAVSLTTSSVSV